MRNQSRWTGMVVGVVMGVLFSAAVVLAGNLEPGERANQVVSQENPSSYLPIILKAGGSSSASVPRTGQTISYGPRDDGALQKGVAWPNPRFTDNANGTVTDNLTGLIWLKDAKCTIFFSGDTNGEKRNWDKALIAANSLGSGNCGLTDGSAAGQWRLPNIKELSSLIDHAFFSPVLSNAVGTGKWSAGDPFTVHLDSGYWSSTTLADNTDSAWGVPLEDGNVADADKTGDERHVWPVRGSSSAGVPRTGQTISYGPRDDGALQKGVAWPNPRFTDNANGTVTDNLTGLIWLKNATCTIFFSGDTNGEKRNWDNALIAANSLGSGNCGLTDGSAAGQWRLPNIKELSSLIDHGFFNPVLSNAVGTGKWSAGDPFNVHLDLGYWSSTTLAGNPGSAWGVPLYNGNVADAEKTNNGVYVWPVRGGQ